MKQLFFGIYLMFLTFSIHAEDINTTIINGTKSTYETLLINLNKETSPSSERTLQRSLLKTLIDHTHKEIDYTDTASPPRNSDAYRLLFYTYIDNVIESQVLENKWLANQKKIKIIETEIKNFSQKNERLLSLELQDALYHQNSILYRKQIGAYHKKMLKTAALLESSLKYIEIDRSNVLKTIEKMKLLAQKLHYDISKLQIGKEQTELRIDSKNITFINEKIVKIQTMYQDTLKEIASYSFLLFSKALQDHSSNVFNLGKHIVDTLENISEFTNTKHTVLILITSMEKEYLGQIKTLEGSGIQELNDIVHQGWGFINHPIFEINHTPVSIFKIFMAISLIKPVCGCLNAILDFCTDTFENLYFILYFSYGLIVNYKILLHFSFSLPITIRTKGRKNGEQK